MLRTPTSKILALGAVLTAGTALLVQNPAPAVHAPAVSITPGFEEMNATIPVDVTTESFDLSAVWPHGREMRG